MGDVLCTSRRLCPLFHPTVLQPFSAIIFFFKWYSSVEQAVGLGLESVEMKGGEQSVCELGDVCTVVSGSDLEGKTVLVKHHVLCKEDAGKAPCISHCFPRGNT